MLNSIRKGSTVLGLVAVLFTGLAQVAGVGLMVDCYTTAGNKVTTTPNAAKTAKAIAPVIVKSTKV